MLGWREKVREMDRLAEAWDEFRSINWAAHPNEIARKQADHKKKPATDAQLDAFHAIGTARRSVYRLHFIAAEFCGARPEEFGDKGVRVELFRHQGVVALRFWIVGAKQGDGSKGQPLRSVVSPFPKGAPASMAGRWGELAQAAGTAGGELVLSVEASQKLTAGQKLSRAFSQIANKVETSGPKLAMYSLRNRFSAQVKDSNASIEDVAVLLGHQSVETQRHYGRARRGGGSVSPARVVSDGAGETKPVRNKWGKSKGNPVKPKKAPAAPAASTAMPPSKPALAGWRAALAQPQAPRAPRPPGFA